MKMKTKYEPIPSWVTEKFDKANAERLIAERAEALYWDEDEDDIDIFVDEEESPSVIETMGNIVFGMGILIGMVICLAAVQPI